MVEYSGEPSGDPNEAGSHKVSYDHLSYLYESESESEPKVEVNLTQGYKPQDVDALTKAHPIFAKIKIAADLYKKRNLENRRNI